MAKRMHFLELVVKAAKSAAGDDFIVGVRLSQITVTDSDYQWPEGEDAMIKVVKAMESWSGLHSHNRYGRNA